MKDFFVEIVKVLKTITTEILNSILNCFKT